jgi:acetyl esterase/lipase
MALRLFCKCSLLSIGLATATAGSAQDYKNYETVRNAAKFDIDWKSFYEQGNAQTAAAQTLLPHVLDMAYASDPKQKLDIYLPPHGGTKAPVLLFLHGGGFVEGDRAHYGFIAPAYAKQGVIVVIASYRLVSAGFLYPVPTDDTKMAIAWLHANIARFGGDPDNLVISGHSAGALLAAQVVADRSWMRAAGIPPSAVRAMVPVSGAYDFPADDRSRDNFLATPEARDAASPLRHIADPAPRAIIATGSTEDYFREPSRRFDAALRAKGVASELIIVPGDHRASVRALGDPASPLFKAVLAVLKR